MAIALDKIQADPTTFTFLASDEIVLEVDDNTVDASMVAISTSVCKGCKGKMVMYLCAG